MALCSQCSQPLIVVFAYTMHRSRAPAKRCPCEQCKGALVSKATFHRHQADVTAAEAAAALAGEAAAAAAAVVSLVEEAPSSPGQCSSPTPHAVS